MPTAAAARAGVSRGRVDRQPALTSGAPWGREPANRSSSANASRLDPAIGGGADHGSPAGVTTMPSARLTAKPGGPGREAAGRTPDVREGALRR
ncbi:hypothetical protein [Streptomyces goshikiensis]|uniref:hypothetical protein n=1 Tax=Streptomyces goshikiensis TaxID=1942 RepID=UPI0036C89AD2